MHILVTNDDGPPSPESSPYVHCLIKHLQQAGHTLKPLYYRPGAKVHGDDSEDTTHHRPSAAGDVEEWILIDGTPASCVQIGLHHFFHDKGPIDLVVSGPNYGRNTSSVFALSSGTLGAALEAAVCKRRSIALSFAFFSRNHDPVIIEAACRHSVRVIDALYKQWPTDASADLYSVNVPLVEDVEKHKTLWTNVLQNYWAEGSCFQEIDGEAGDAVEEEARIREGPGGEVENDGGSQAPTAQVNSTSGGKAEVGGESRKTGHVHKHFKWAPRLTDVYKSVAESEPGNDGRTVMEGNTSITPLKANFALGTSASFSRKELELSSQQVAGVTSMAIRGKGHGRGGSPIRAIVAYDDTYVQPLIVAALKTLLPDDTLHLITELQPLDGGGPPVFETPSDPNVRLLQITAYESIDFEFAAAHPRSCLVNSYMIRKALIRKHYLSATVDHWVAKHPSSPLGRHFKRSEAFEVDYAEFLDDALVEAFDLRESMDRNAELADEAARQWWILKPGMSDRGQGIRLFSTMEELQAIFDGWDEERPDSDEEEEEEDGQGQTGEEKGQGMGDFITTSHLRHFVAQPYIHRPLLLESDPRKFHIRTYVLCTGSLTVHVYKPMLALFAAKPYLAPWAHSPTDIDSFLTNTCLQQQRQQPSDGAGANSVRRFWDLPLAQPMLDDIFAQICSVTGEALEAAATAMPVHFQTLPNAFEVFGLDFLVDEAGVVWLLEANAFPDFRQTGADLEDVVGGFWRGVVREAVLPFFGVEASGGEDRGDMVRVKQIDLGRR
ncbi:tubulin-tyrosine ligase family domain-containing protein [Hirsutella rhossiliensis]|uniref:Tubulin-tyrosine ligase family domain-containing protein n=1 Tax=Hirsutella rhossiliensis TaxID=111463 RepID=A0A9P8MM11_9HYPO|nr:tubulin-tyrosine ligase family domain-containing protein [Hirsutella rhossiliensis]KAH0958693.1 tubulin-tyrosine ligase family domain-containing protein [Hirsutella rhossiliensis]